MLVTLDARCRGSEHIKTEKPLQDYSGSSTDKWKSYAYALIADGHGGEKYFRSADGSRFAVLFAVEAMNKVLKDLLFYIKKKDTDVIDKTLDNLCSRILILWREKVKAHYMENPLTEKEIQTCEELKLSLPLSDDDIYTLYGSTLLASAYFDNFDFWFSLQIGDGKTIAIKQDDSIFYPIEEDEDMGFGVTASLCGKSAKERFHYNFGYEKLNGIAVMSDGMADSFDSEKLPDFILKIQKNALENVDVAKTELQSFLPKLSEQGSGDDISIAGIFHKENENSLLNKILLKR